MCFRNNWIDEKPANMTWDIFSGITDYIKENGAESVMFAGMGEPLIHKNIIDMVREISSLGVYTELLTNGTLLNREMAEKLVDAGLSGLWVSVDEFEEEKYKDIQKGSDFNRITENITYFNSVKKNCKMGMTTVVMKENLSSLDKVNDFADKYGFDIINISHVIPCAPLDAENCVYDSDIKIGKQHRLGGKAEKKYNFCPFIEDGNCFIKSNGDVMPCMQLLHSSYTYLYEEKRCVKAKSFGNIRTESLKNIWNSDEYKLFRENVHQFNFPDCTLCNGCDDRLENETDCMFNSHPTCGACLWAQGIARCP